ncbi:hypothetical protein GCM10010517_20060 [Streptosporangium fragile]|uniref:TIGR04222 domain-containing membrane protein n=1 Tax=Streptosporangium fragile TaxID=46186 RepID=A0ABN3VVN4_9ACTN
MLVALIFAAAVLGLVGAIWASASAVRGEYARVRAVTSGYYGGPLYRYDLAYLSGGPRRVVNTAIAVLSRVGAVRVSRGGRVSLVAGAAPSPVPMEQALMEALRVRGGSGDLGELRRAMAEGPAMRKLNDRMLKLGLIVPDGALDRLGKPLKRLHVVSILGLVAHVVGFIGAFVTHEPGSKGITASGIFITAAGVGLVSGTSGGIAHRDHRRALRDVLSRAGRDALDSARRTYRKGIRPVTPDLAFAVAVPIALYGLDELRDPILREELGRETARAEDGCATGFCGGGSPSSSTGESGSGCWGEGDGGCGGCGGGCGGCGG